MKANLREEIPDLLRTDRAFREEVRRQLLTDELLALPERFDQLTKLVGGFIEAQRRQGEQMEALIAAQQRTEEALPGLITWQQGEEGRRRREWYEREILKSAPVLFNGGRGGTPDQPWVQQRLTEQLMPLLAGDIVEPEANPFLPNLIWWKGERVAVVEVSYLVNGYDINRAAGQAQTIRRTGAEAVAIVIGKDWATEESPGQALRQHVEWDVGTSLSDGLIEFRRAPST